MSTKRENGIALITALLVLFMVSALIVGMSWMVMTDQRLGGNNGNHETAFYGAEAGMEKMTADLGTLFTQYGSLSASNIQTVVGSAPSIPGISYVNSAGQSTYSICYPDANNNKVCQGQGANPGAIAGTIQDPSPYSGLQALVTNYTLTVTAATPAAGEVKLQRIVQTSDIPVFQFGVFSNVDLGFHAGDNFLFGGRVHTNGNLWLAAGSGDWLDLPSKVTTAKEIITSTAMNGVSTSNWPGAVNITNGSAYVNLKTQTPTQSIGGTSWNIQTLDTAEDNSSYSYNTNFSNLASGTYNGNIGVKETGVTPLNLSIVTSSLGGQAIDLIRMPVPGEDTSAPAKLGLRYYGVASLRIMLADYGPDGTCTTSDISPSAANPLPYISSGVPVDLASLAWNANLGSGNANPSYPPYKVPPTWLNGTNVYPLPLSAATSTAYGSAGNNGYWVRANQPVITGCIKIDYQSSTNIDTFTDETQQILNLGFTGQQIASVSGSANNFPAEPSGQSLLTCSSPNNALTLSPNSVIRLARLRDNPSTHTNCVAPTTLSGQDYFPNVLFDSREALLRENTTTPSGATLAGAMYYVELDVNNLSRCLTGAIAGCAGFNTSVNNTTGYTVYFSDRRGNRFDPNPPASVPPTTGSSAKTGGFGYSDFINESNATTGCPNSTLDQGEDVESDYTQTGDSENTSTTPRTYGALPILYTDINSGGNAAVPANWGSWAMSDIPTATAGETFSNGNVASVVLANNSTCTGSAKTWPFAQAANTQDLRQNMPLVFRRALKIVNGKTISLGTCNGVVCGLTIASENPVYLQGDYNNPGAPSTCSSFTQCFPNPDTSGGGVAASVAADAVTVLSNAWNDEVSFLPANLYTATNRNASAQTTYRTAIAAGKSMGFPNPSGTTEDTGLDGGVHNFLRYLEDWSSSNIWYQGSFVALFYSHQAVGSFKYGDGNVYGVPNTRNENFDTTFQTPADLPPRTPMLRNVNTIGFTQELMPTQ